MSTLSTQIIREPVVVLSKEEALKQSSQYLDNSTLISKSGIVSNGQVMQKDMVTPIVSDIPRNVPDSTEWESTPYDLQLESDAIYQGEENVIQANTWKIPPEQRDVEYVAHVEVKKPNYTPLLILAGLILLLRKK